MRPQNLEYAADATAMAPRPDLSWQQLHVKGNWQGTLATAVAAGEVQAQGLQLPGNIRIQDASNASLAAHGGDLNARPRLGSAPRHQAYYWRFVRHCALGGAGFDSAGTGNAPL